MESLFGKLPKLFSDEDELRAIWGDPETRRTLLNELAARGFGREPEAGCLEIIEALGAMRLVQCFRGLQLDQKRLLDQQVHEVLADHRAVIHDRDAAVLCEGKSCLSQLMGQRVLINLLQKSRPERIEDCEGAADSVPRWTAPLEWHTGIRHTVYKGEQVCPEGEGAVSRVISNYWC